MAKSVGTAAVLSDNRVRLGVGVGWCEEEYVQTGQDFHNRGKRLERHDPRPAGPVAGRLGRVPRHPLRRPRLPDEPLARRCRCPIIGGGDSDAALRRASTLCDGWVNTGAVAPRRGVRPGREDQGRPQAGRTGQRAVLHLPGACKAFPDLDLYRRLEDAGVTDLLCAPWMAVQATEDDTPESIHAARVAVCEQFAEHIIGGHGLRIVPVAALGPVPSCTDAKVVAVTLQGGTMKDMKLGLQLGYWGSGPPANARQQVAEAERLGFDSIWTAEAYGSDALTPLSWWGSQTERVRLGTALCQLSARTPTAMGMAAITLDHLSGGRFVLGLGCVRARRSSRVGTASRSRSRWPGPSSTSTSCAR